MSDNKEIRSQQDRIRVDAADHSEVEYLHQKFPKLRHAEIVKAIQKAGPFRKQVIAYLRTKAPG